jgi:hypothetical protein
LKSARACERFLDFAKKIRLQEKRDGDRGDDKPNQLEHGAPWSFSVAARRQRSRSTGFQVALVHSMDVPAMGESLHQIVPGKGLRRPASLHQYLSDALQSLHGTIRGLGSSHGVIEEIGLRDIDFVRSAVCRPASPASAGPADGASHAGHPGRQGLGGWAAMCGRYAITTDPEAVSAVVRHHRAGSQLRGEGSGSLPPHRDPDQEVIEDSTIEGP